MSIYGAKYSGIDQLKFMEDSLQKIWSDMVCLSRPDHITSKFLKAVFHKFHLVHSWILCLILGVTVLKSLTQKNSVFTLWKLKRTPLLTLVLIYFVLFFSIDLFLQCPSTFCMTSLCLIFPYNRSEGPNHTNLIN